MYAERNLNPISIESEDSLSHSPPIPHDSDQYFEEGFGSIDPFKRLSERRQKIPVGVSISQQNVSIAEFGSVDDILAKTDLGCTARRQRKLLYVNPKSKIHAASIDAIRVEYNIPDTIMVRPPSSSERVDMNLGDWCPMYIFPFVEGFRFPFPPLVTSVLNHFEVAPCQLMPNAWRVLLSLCRFAEVFGKGIELEDFMTCYTLQDHDADKGRLKTVVRTSDKRLVSGMTDNYRGWKDKYLFFKGNDMFASNSPEFPLAWKPFSKEFNRLPHLTTDRKKKLDFLLSLPEEKRHFSRLLRKSDLFSSYLWAQVRLNSTVANGTRPLSVSELIRLRCLERIGFSLHPLWSLSDVNRIRADNLIDKMSFKIPSMEDAWAAAAKKGKSQSISASAKSTDLASNMLVTQSVEVGQSKRQRTDYESEVKSILISEDTNVFLDPSTIEHHVDELATESELKQIKEMGAIGVADDIVASSYRALIDATSLRNATKTFADRVKQQQKKISDLTKEKDVLNEEIKHLKVKAAQVDQLEIDLNVEKKKVDDLMEEMNSLATVCLVQARGGMMLEYSRGRAAKWNVQHELDMFKSFLPKDYADAVVKLDKEDGASDTIDGASEMVDHLLDEPNTGPLP